jgi:shikimate kinase
MMGSGKSTVGAYLASALGYAFIDTDVVIERTLQKSISEVFAQEGEAYFRQVETLVMDSLQSHLRKVIATGGGVVLGQRNWGTLQTGLVVYLRATPELLVQRVEHGVGRPLLSTTSGPAADAAPISVRQEALQERLERILSEREHLYRQADVIMELDADMSVAQVAKAIALLLSQFIDEHPSVSSKFGTQQTAEP